MTRAHDFSRAPVHIGATYWVVNGVNVFSANLARGLKTMGRPSHILLTESATSLISFSESLMPMPEDVPFQQLPVRRSEPWGAHWGEMIRMLESDGPCIYIPNSDWRHSCVCPLLSDTVGIVGIVHSDDPLHYDHVRRLGASWNAIVAVSAAIAERTAELLPELADRIVTIPIGARFPAVRPQPRRHSTDVLRLIYHGSIKRQQKRVFDLPLIVEALAARQVPVHLTIAGGGPDEHELRTRCQPLVARGLIAFTGVVSHDRIAELLGEHDAYLLASEFEGMPNALIEAMGAGLVPVVTRVASGSTELVQDGVSGFLVDVGDVESFADRLQHLQRNRDVLDRLAYAAFDAVANSYRVEDMVRDYNALFDKVLTDVAAGRFRRERGELSHPPPQVAGINLFPVPLPYAVPGIGQFPSERDFRVFRNRIRQIPNEKTKQWIADTGAYGDAALQQNRLPNDVRIIFGAPVWSRNGVNLQTYKLLRGLIRRGYSARLLLTEEATDLVTIDDQRFPWPDDVPVDLLPVGRDECWGAHWGATIRYLESQAPCVYLPTYDWRHACVAPQLSNRITTIGSLTGGDAVSEEQVLRLESAFNAVVTADGDAGEAVRERHPVLDGRLIVIPEGVDIPSELPECRTEPRSLSDLLICTSSNDQWAADLPLVLQTIADAGLTPKATLLGSAGHPEWTLSDHIVLRHWLNDALDVVNWPPAPDALSRHTVVVAWIASAHVPHELLEAMGHGCIPFLILRDAEPHAMFSHAENCFVFAHDDLDAMALCLTQLAKDVRLQRSMAMAAHLSVSDWFTTFDDVLDHYVALFSRAVSADGISSRPRDPSDMRPPPAYVNDISVYPVDLPFEVAGVGRFSSEFEYAEFERVRNANPQ